MGFEYLLTCLPPLLVAYSLSKLEHVILGVNCSAVLALYVAQLSSGLVPETSAWVRIRHMKLQALRSLGRCSGGDRLRGYNS